MDAERRVGDFSGIEPGIRLGAGGDRLVDGYPRPDGFDFSPARRHADGQVWRQTCLWTVVLHMRRADVPAFHCGQLSGIRLL